MASARFRMGRSTLLAGPYTWGNYDERLQFAAGEYGKVELESTAGVNSIAVTIPTGDEDSIAATLPAVTVNQSTKTATWQMPAVPSTVNVSVTINNGALNGIAQPAYTSTLQAYVPTDAGNVLFAVGEEDQYSRAYGHTPKMNALVRGANGSLRTQMQGTVTTTAATPTKAVITIPTPTTSRALMVTAHICGRDSTGDAGGYTQTALLKFAVGGGWTIVGQASTVAYEDDAGWGAAFVVAGTTVELRVTGDAANDTSWSAVADIVTRTA